MSPVRMGKIESAARAGLSLYRAINARDLDAVMALIAADCVLDPAAGAEICGASELRSYFSERIAALGSDKIAIEDMKGLGKHCLVYWRWGERRGIDVIFVEDDRVRRVQSYLKA